MSSVLFNTATVCMAAYSVLELLGIFAPQEFYEAAESQMRFLWRVAVACLLAAIYLRG